MKIGVLIPTRGDRKEFLSFALDQIKRQYLQPDFIEVVNDIPKDEKPDITYRYRIGCERLASKGADLIICWEDDDWYDEKYLNWMKERWIEQGMPDLIGISKTIYYHIFTQKYKTLIHPGRASMMSTGISAKALSRIDWCEDNYSYTDMHLWTKCKGLTKWAFSPATNITLGIKHGQGLCGGGGHIVDWGHYDSQDENYKFLKKIIDETAEKFYFEMKEKSKYRYEVVSFSEKPFLTIITRVLEGKRNGLFDQHKKSVSGLSLDREQIFIIDPVGYGMLAANTSLSLVKDMINGEYIHLQDDDDFYTDGEFIRAIKEASHAFPDVIMFKAKILTGDGDEMYPKPGSWKTKQVKRGQIGGGCFVIRKWVYEKYIHLFSQPSFGDWNFINTVLQNPAVTVKWLDRKFVETGKVSRGAAE